MEEEDEIIIDKDEEFIVFKKMFRGRIIILLVKKIGIRNVVKISLDDE